jgi:hypothetical protein
MTPIVVVVDRIEEDVAVVEFADRAFADVPLAVLPPGVAEGERLILRWQPFPTFGPRPGEVPPRGAGAVAAGRPGTTGAPAPIESDHAHP